MRTPLTGLVASTSIVLLATTMTGPMAQATQSPPSHPSSARPSSPAWTTVATGLDNPRHLSFSGRLLHVAESGRGGAGPCVPGPEGMSCVGSSGAITRITARGQRRVLTRLPSAADPHGESATGPTDVEFDGRQYTISLGLGNDPTVRSQLGRSGALFGTVVTARPTKNHRHGKHSRRGHRHSQHTAVTPRVLADLAAFEAKHDPDRAGPDSNPGGITRSRMGLVAVDSGGNSLVLVSQKRGTRNKAGHAPRARVSLLATFGDRMVPAPPFLPPGEIPMQAVPTSVVVGADGAYYVSQLTGFPFPAQASTVWRVVPGEAPTAFAQGLTNVTDLAWHRGALYVVQLADQGLLAVGADELPQGSLRRVTANSNTVVAEGLAAPYGVALKGNNAFVTTCSVCAGGGSVVRIPLA